LNPALFAGIGAFAAYLFSVASRPGGAANLPTAALQDIEAFLLQTRSLSAAQVSATNIIRTVAESKGFGWLVPAMVANAYAESLLDPAAIGDGGRAVGLFQIHPWGGSVEDRLDPAKNTSLILSDAGVRTVSALRGRATHAELASAFAQYVERCAACSAGGSELPRRAALVSQLYGAELARTVSA
jgi:hypothetical protein